MYDRAAARLRMARAIDAIGEPEQDREPSVVKMKRTAFHAFGSCFKYVITRKNGKTTKTRGKTRGETKSSS